MGADYLRCVCAWPTLHDGTTMDVTNPRHRELIFDRFKEMLANERIPYVYAFEECTDPAEDADAFDDEATVIFGDKLDELNDTFTSREVTTLEIDGRLYMETGGMSWGDDPTEAFPILSFFDDLGIFQAPFVDPHSQLSQLLAAIPDIDEILDEMVHEAKAEEAAAINNGGRSEQIAYLISRFGSEGLLSELRNAL